MKKYCFILVILIASNLTVSGQAAKSIFFEIGGPGLASVNFDTRFGPREDGLGGRVGFGGFSVNVFDDERDVLYFIPLGLNYLLGKDKKNYFEFGAGITPVIYSGGGRDETFATTFGHLLFGYRLQPLNGGFSFRGFMSPVFGQGGFLPLYGGISFGYKF